VGQASWPVAGVSTFPCDFPPVHALYVGQALSPGNSLCSTAESFPTGIPISRRQPSCLSPGVWPARSPVPYCRSRPWAGLDPPAETSSSWTVKWTKRIRAGLAGGCPSSEHSGSTARKANLILGGTG
jgi:hypothetical protein